MKVQYPVDRAMFYNSTYILIGNSRNTPFLEARWLNGAAPKDIAPGLYNSARFKNRCVHTELENHRWIRNIKEVNTPLLLEEFVLLYLALSTVTLTDQSDKIIWKWTQDGKYTVASAYDCQFKGATTTFPASNIWQVVTEPKCNFFAWLVMHNKAPTADNFAKKKHWPCNPLCSLCYCQSENAQHLLTECNYTEALWNWVTNLYNLPIFAQLNTSSGPIQWVRTLLSSGAKKQKMKKSAILFFCGSSRRKGTEEFL
jgi:hypothetical protein